MEAIKVVMLYGGVGSGKKEIVKHLIFNHGFVELFWSHRPLQDLSIKLECENKVICNDYKFVTDQKLKKIFNGVQLWRILRKEVPIKEIDIRFDRTLKNYGTLGELKTAVDGMILSPRPR